MLLETSSRVLIFIGVFLIAHVQSIPSAMLPPTQPQLGPKRLRRTRSLSMPFNNNRLPGFRYIYVERDGSIKTFRKQTQPIAQIEISGSPGTSVQAMYNAAAYVSNITKNVSPMIFYRIASKTSVGIFSAEEKLTVFPEFSYLRNSKCGSSCDNYCARTCTVDGRKIEDLAGVGAKRAVILDDNILCSKNDPYQGKENILAHEFTHTIHQYVLTKAQKSKIANAFEVARSRKTWRQDSYAMVSIYEYFAEGATVFFGVNHYNRINTGGMNWCGSEFCATKEFARKNLRQHDSLLFDVLSEVFTWNRPFQMNKLSVCPSGQN